MNPKGQHRGSKPAVGRSRALLSLGLLCVGVAAFGWVVTVVTTGGLHVRLWGWRVTSADPWRAALLSVLSIGAWLAMTRAPGESVFARLARSSERIALWAAVAGSVLIVAFALRFGTFSASGADPSGYVSQAHRLLDGTLRRVEPLAATSPWPDATWTLAPLGYRPGTSEGTIVPTYAAGLPLLMAGAIWLAGSCGAFYVAPACGGALVLLTFLLGRRLVKSAPALVGAWLVATSPAFLSQVVLPMSDIPAAAGLTGALLFATSGRPAAPLVAGLLTSCAVVIRPNLAVATLAIAVAAALHGAARATPARSPRRVDARRLARFLAGAMPGFVFVACVNAYLYGAPWESGYGRLESLYALSNVWPNLVRYAGWLVETNTPAVLVGLAGLAAAPWIGPPDARNPNLSVAMALLVLTVAGQYLLYAPFAEWWYLRFLLPVWPAVMIMTAGAGYWILCRILPARAAVCLILLIGIAVGILTASNAQRLGVFRARQLERRYVDVGRFAAEALPGNAVFITAQHSGSLQFYARRPILRFDLLHPDWLDRSIDHLRRGGYHPLILLEDWEVDGFRRRFSGTNVAGRLDWCPRAVMRRPVPVLVYDTDMGSCGAGTQDIPAVGAGVCGPLDVAVPPVSASRMGR